MLARPRQSRNNFVWLYLIVRVKCSVLYVFRKNMYIIESVAYIMSKYKLLVGKNTFWRL